eukprot:jgi/Chrzof1/1506/Cz10g10110.t1
MAAACETVLLQYEGRESMPVFWLPISSDVIWKGSYQNKNWKYKKEGGWVPLVADTHDYQPRSPQQHMCRRDQDTLQLNDMTTLPLPCIKQEKQDAQHLLCGPACNQHTHSGATDEQHRVAPPGTLMGHEPETHTLRVMREGRGGNMGARRGWGARSRGRVGRRGRRGHGGHGATISHVVQTSPRTIDKGNAVAGVDNEGIGNVSNDGNHHDDDDNDHADDDDGDDDDGDKGDHHKAAETTDQPAYHGVQRCPHARTPRWAAHVDVSGRHIHLGTFSSAQAAANAYDCAMLALRGQTAVTNLPADTYKPAQIAAAAKKLGLPVPQLSFAKRVTDKRGAAAAAVGNTAVTTRDEGQGPSGEAAQQQGQTRAAQRNGPGTTVRYRGVGINHGKWYAQIRVEGRQRFLGYAYTSAEAAARAFDCAAIATKSAKAVTNFPASTYSQADIAAAAAKLNIATASTAKGVSKHTAEPVHQRKQVPDSTQQGSSRGKRKAVASADDNAQQAAGCSYQAGTQQQHKMIYAPPAQTGAADSTTAVLCKGLCHGPIKDVTDVAVHSTLVLSSDALADFRLTSSTPMVLDCNGCYYRARAIQAQSVWCMPATTPDHVGLVKVGGLLQWHCSSAAGGDNDAHYFVVGARVKVIQFQFVGYEGEGVFWLCAGSPHIWQGPGPNEEPEGWRAVDQTGHGYMRVKPQAGNPPKHKTYAMHADANKQKQKQQGVQHHVRKGGRPPKRCKQEQHHQPDPPPQQQQHEHVAAMQQQAPCQATKPKLGRPRRRVRFEPAALPPPSSQPNQDQPRPSSSRRPMAQPSAKAAAVRRLGELRKDATDTVVRKAPLPLSDQQLEQLGLQSNTPMVMDDNAQYYRARVIGLQEVSDQPPAAGRRVEDSSVGCYSGQLSLQFQFIGYEGEGVFWLCAGSPHIWQGPGPDEEPEGWRAVDQDCSDSGYVPFLNLAAMQVINIKQDPATVHHHAQQQTGMLPPQHCSLGLGMQPQQQQQQQQQQLQQPGESADLAAADQVVELRQKQPPSQSSSLSAASADELNAGGDSAVSDACTNFLVAINSVDLPDAIRDQSMAVLFKVLDVQQEGSLDAGASPSSVLLPGSPQEQYPVCALLLQLHQWLQLWQNQQDEDQIVNLLTGIAGLARVQEDASSTSESLSSDHLDRASLQSAVDLSEAILPALQMVTTAEHGNSFSSLHQPGSGAPSHDANTASASRQAASSSLAIAMNAVLRLACMGCGTDTKGQPFVHSKVRVWANGMRALVSSCKTSRLCRMMPLLDTIIPVQC